MERMTKTIDWVKLPVNLMDDARVAELMARKGMAGLGVYLAVVSEMFRRRGRCLTMTQLRALKFVNTSIKTVVQVVEDYGLFRKDCFGHYYSVIDFLRFDDAPVQASVGYDNVGKTPPETAGQPSTPSEGEACATLTPPDPTPARINRDTDKDYILLEVGAEAAQAEKRAEADTQAVGQTAVEQAEKRAEECIRQLPLQSAWAEVTLMKSGFGELLLRNWPIALEEFCKHVLVNRTAESILDVECAKQYFYRYATNPASGRLLRQALEEHERLQQTEGCYRYEDTGSAPGHRSYHGIPLPDDAPPRPDNLSDWDFENRCWVS